VSTSRKIQDLSVVLGDPNGFSRQIVRSALGGYGVRRISDCRDGFEVVEAVQRFIPSVVVIDHELAGLDALEVTRMLGREPSTQMLPVVVMSAAPSRALVTGAILAGAHEFVAKPFSSQTLFERVSRSVFVPRQFLRTRTFFGPAPYDQVMRERLEKEVAELNGIAALPTIEEAFKVKEDEFVSI
jgi:two-component system, chemotaxis family, chemotaxis protein CheY